MPKQYCELGKYVLLYIDFTFLQWFKFTAVRQASFFRVSKQVMLYNLSVSGKSKSSPSEKFYTRTCFEIEKIARQLNVITV